MYIVTARPTSCMPARYSPANTAVLSRNPPPAHPSPNILHTGTVFQTAGLSRCLYSKHDRSTALQHSVIINNGTRNLRPAELNQSDLSKASVREHRDQDPAELAQLGRPSRTSRRQFSYDTFQNSRHTVVHSDRKSVV